MISDFMCEAGFLFLTEDMQNTHNDYIRAAARVQLKYGEIAEGY